MHRRHLRGSVAVLAALPVLATGCGFELVRSDDADTESSPSSDGDAAEDSTPAADATRDDGDADGDAAGDREADADGSKADAPEVEIVDPGQREAMAVARGQGEFNEVRVLDLRRSRDQLILDFEIVLGQEGGPELDPRLFQDYSVDGNNDAVSGVRLVDWDNGRRHYILNDLDKKCLCSRWSGNRVEAGVPVVHSAHFPAPPDDVTHMAVEVPHFPIIDDVPIRGGS